MAKESIFGHQSPDTDAIGTAIAYSHFQNHFGFGTEAVTLDGPDDETASVLKKSGLEVPRVAKTAANEVDTVMLVDRNEPQQSISGIDKVTVTHVVDHHKIMNLSTAAPLYFRDEPVGYTSTAPWQMFNGKGLEIPQNIAGITLSVVISDTLFLKSPTTTDKGHRVVEALTKIAGVDYKSYGLETLKTDTNIADRNEKDSIDLDIKSSELSGHAVRIARTNVAGLPEAMEKRAALINAIEASSKTNSYDMLILVLTDILEGNSEGVIVDGDETKALFERAFGKKLVDGAVELSGIVLRKRQVVPPLTEALEG